MRNSRIIKSGILLLAGILIGGYGAARLTQRHFIALYGEIKPIRAADASYPLINPLLSYDFPNGKKFDFNTSLANTIEKFISKKTASHDATDISVYYRDLERGSWVGINENKAYDPASLMKIVLVIAYYQQAQNNPGLLQKPIVYSRALDTALKAVPFQTPSNLTVGQSYTVDQLIDDLMIHSDNGAKNALLSGINPHALAGVYTDLGVENPDDSNPAGYVISSRTYSLFFRILYNATYLDRAMSEKILDLLARARYQDGIIAGVPAGTKVAQKYGEHVSVDANGNPTSFELHDCGIVYKPSPYLLCVMTRGTDITKLTATIQQISQLVYTQSK